MTFPLALGACYLGGRRCLFRVWAPFRNRVDVRILGRSERYERLAKTKDGYHEDIVEDIECGSLYWYRLDDKMDRPDPASRYQPHGVHGPSQVIDPYYVWRDVAWSGVPLRDYVIYELHVGTFTQDGTFEAIIPHLARLKDLGVTTLELMPVAQFPGSRNWGYDGVHPFAVQNSYGGPAGLKTLVDESHRMGLAVVMDVVYNHLGPEGNYLWDFGPYFTDRYRTPWGPAINFDGAYADEVRHFFVSNALYWVDEFHIDALRLDAVHGIYDFSARHILEELTDSVHDLGKSLNRSAYVIAESDLNDSRLIRPREIGGYGMDSQWNDDFHHALHTLLTGESDGYYTDFGEVKHLVKALKEGYVYSGERSHYRRRRHGNSSAGLPCYRFVVFSQNHDQVGNRAYNERLSQMVSADVLKLAAGIVLLSPYVPLIFMGEEYGEVSPFPYFISHSDPELVDAVRKGRREEFAAFSWKEELLNPQDEKTFDLAKLEHDLRLRGTHFTLFEFYRELIALRKELRDRFGLSRDRIDVVCVETTHVVMMRHWKETAEAMLFFNMGRDDYHGSLPLPAGVWQTRLDSADLKWNGTRNTAEVILSQGGNATLDVPGWSFVVLIKQHKGTEES